MFGHTIIPPASQITASKFSRSQMPSSAKRREAVPIQARTPLSNAQRARSPSPVQKQNHPSVKISERYTNREYNRQPSPLSRFQRPSSKPEGPRPTTPSSLGLQRAMPAASRGDVVKQREMGTVANPRERPKTADPIRVGKPLMSSPSVESRVLLTVKDVLSKAVFEKGRIDENNIETILQDMQARLNVEDEEEPRAALDLEKKTSKTSVNVNSSTEDVLQGKQKPFGFVRRSLEPTRRSSKVYRRIYNKIDLPQNKEPSGGRFGEEGEEVVYVDLPDPDYSNFNSLVRRRKEKLKENDITVSKKELKPEVTEQEEIAAEVVGDYKMKEKSSEMWKSAEDAKLQKYIESLIKNMNHQLSGDHTAQEIEEELKEKTFCKSICVCKVCVSNRSSSQKALQSQASQVEVKSVKQTNSKLKGRVESTNISLDLNKEKMKSTDKAPSTGSSTRMKFKILKKNHNFQPESKISISSRTLVNKPSTNKSFTVMNPPVDEEAEEDLYLQRRISRVSGGRRTTSRRM